MMHNSEVSMLLMQEIDQLKKQNKALLSACKRVQYDAVSLGSGENAISDEARDMVAAAIAQCEGAKQ